MMANKVIEAVEFYARECYSILKLLAWTLLLCGVDLKNEICYHERKPKCRERILGILTVLFLSFCAGFWIVITVSLFGQQLPMLIICTFVTTLCFSIDVAMFRII